MRVPSLTPGGDLDRVRFVRRSRPVPWHFGHGCSITVPLPRQRGHGCESAKSPWLSTLTPRPLHSGQMIGAVPGCAPVPPHSRHAVVELDRHLRLDAAQRVLEREVDVGLDVRAAQRAGAAPRAAPRRRRKVRRRGRRGRRSPKSNVDARRRRRVHRDRSSSRTGRTACASPGPRARRTRSAPP